MEVESAGLNQGVCTNMGMNRYGFSVPGRLSSLVLSQ